MDAVREERKLRNHRKKIKKDLGLNGNIDKACFRSKDVREELAQGRDSFVLEVAGGQQLLGSCSGVCMSVGSKLMERCQRISDCTHKLRLFEVLMEKILGGRIVLNRVSIE